MSVGFDDCGRCFAHETYACGHCMRERAVEQASVKNESDYQGKILAELARIAAAMERLAAR